MSSILLPDGWLRREAVTAGVPSLSPLRRGILDYRHAQRIKSRAMTAEAKSAQAVLTAPDGDRPTTSPEAQLGRPLHSRDIILRLRKLNPNLVFERSKADPSVMGIYIPSPGANSTDPDLHYRGLQHILGFEFGYSPEFTINRTDNSGKWVGQTRGWRKVLAALIRCRLIDRCAAETLFAIPAGPQSRNWHLQVN